MANTLGGHLGGQPTKYNEIIVAAAEEYLLNYKDHDHAIPSVIGMAMVLGVGKSTLYDWAGKDGNKFSDILPKCNDYQHFALVNGGLKNELNSNIVKLALGKHGYSDKTDSNVNGTIGIEAYELTETERSARIAALLDQGRSRRDGEADNLGSSKVDTTGRASD